MRTIKRAVVASALALPLTLGTAGIASADTSYDENGSFAGADGAGNYSVSAQADGNGDGGGASFEESSSFAGPDGAWSEYVRANADGDGGTSFEQGSNSATDEGASSNNVNSSTDGNGDDEGPEQEQGLLSGLISP